MPVITEYKFLGASVSSVSINGQWNEQTSSLNVKVVEDLSAGDSFVLKYGTSYNNSGIAMGTPVNFTMGNFNLSAIIDSYDESISVDENPVYSVTLSSPVKILDSVQVILDGYIGPGNNSVFNSTPQANGTFGVTNFLNVFGWAEDGGTAFGRSQISPVGMYWGSGPSGTAYGIANGLTYLTSLTPPSNTGILASTTNYFGSQILYKGNTYILDISGLDANNPPSYYTIGGVVNMTLLELVSRFCQDAGVDYLLELTVATGVGGIVTTGPHTIGFQTVPRYIQPTLGQIPTYINSQSGNINQLTYGLEVRPDITQAFLVGGQVNFAQPLSNGVENAVIMPFWGFDTNGNAIVGYTPRATNFADDDHSMYLNGTSIADIFGELGTTIIYDAGGASGAYLPSTTATFNYQSTILELRCALGNMDTWLGYIQRFKPDLANSLGLYGALDINQIQVPGGFEFLIDMLRVDPVYCRQIAVKYGDNHWPAVAQRIYNFVNEQASTYYGKMFTCILPFNMQIKVIPQTFQVQFNNELADAGYLPEGSPILGLNFNNENFFLDDTGRFYPFVSFAFTNSFYSVGSLVYTPGTPATVYADLGATPSSNVVVQPSFSPGDATDVIIGPDGQAEWQYSGSDSTLMYSRCEQGIDGPVTQNGIVGGGSPIFFITLGEGPSYPATVITIGTPIFAQATDVLGGATDMAAMFGADTTDVFVNGLLGKNGPLKIFLNPPALYPNGILVTMKSNQYLYGPWGKRNTDGKLEFEQDEGLTPWDCGSYSVMNSVALARLQTIATSNQILERSTLTIPGTPQYSLYQTLFAGGPIINSIQISVSDGGVLTTYTLETFVNRIGAFTRENADRLKRVGKIYQQLRRTIRQQVLATVQRNAVLREFNNGFMYGTSYAVEDHTPHAALVGTLQYSLKSSGYVPFAFTDTYQESISSLQVGNSGAYFSTACMGMEGLLRPFTNDVSNDNLPWYFAPDSGIIQNSNALTSINFNPFQPGMDITWITSGSGDYQTVNYRTNPDGVDFNSIRGMALKGPMVLQGWGFDIQGLPVPNSGAPLASSGAYYPIQSYSSNFLDNYLSDSIDWPTGPVDLRWDKFRACWASPGMILTGVVSGTTIGPGASGYLRLNTNFGPMDELLNVTNVFKYGSACSGNITIVGYNPLCNRWEIISSDCGPTTC